jgi:hypothetical protein
MTGVIFPYLKQNFNIDNRTIGFYSTVLALGQAFGVLIAKFSVGRFGYRHSMFLFT